MHKTSINGKNQNYARKVAVNRANFFLLSPIPLRSHFTTSHYTSAPPYFTMLRAHAVTGNKGKLKVAMNDNVITTGKYGYTLFLVFCLQYVIGFVTFWSYVNIDSDIELSEIVC